MQRFLLVIMALHPLANKKYFFVDKCLPFRSSCSCMIFQEFSDALAFVAKTITLREHIVKNLALTNYLDDFLFMVLNVQLCNKMMNTFLEVCQQIGCPISDDKTSGEQILLCFLEYMLLNGRAYIVSVLHDKVTKALILLQWAISKKKVTIKFIQQLTGTLNFLKRAIVPGRAFTRGMYAKLKLTNAKGELLKQHHHIWLSKDFTQDCKVWQNSSSVMLEKPSSADPTKILLWISGTKF